MEIDREFTQRPAPPGFAADGSSAPARLQYKVHPADESDPDLVLHVHDEDGWVVVKLPGYPPFPEERTARELREQLYHPLGGSRPVQILLDLGCVHHASSFLVTTLVSLHRKVRDLGGRLALRGVGPEVNLMIHACKLDAMLNIETDEA